MKLLFTCFAACLLAATLLFSFRKASNISESPARTPAFSVVPFKKFEPANTVVIVKKEIHAPTTEKRELPLNESVKPAFSKKKQPAAQAVSNQKTTIKSLIKKNDTAESIITPISYDSVAQDDNTNGSPGDEKNSMAIETPLLNEKAIITDQPVEVKMAEKNTNSAYALSYAATRQTETGSDDYSWLDLYEKAVQLKAYAKKHKYNTQYGFIVNMGMKSGKKRFFVIDLSNMTIVKRGIVSHGHGAARFTLDKKYSNEKGSNCTSLGMYKIGKSYTGCFGASYRLHGLQASNNNAYERSIVLHTMHNIPDQEIDYPIFQSEGCPSVSSQFLKEISTIIDNSSKPVLLWIFDPAMENQASWAKAQ